MLERGVDSPKISLTRVVFEFLPTRGGSVTHIIELARHIDRCLASQLIIAPEAEGVCHETDSSVGVPIKRVKCPRFPLRMELARMPMRPIILLLYSFSSLKAVINSITAGTRPSVIQVHGTMLGAAFCFASKLKDIQVPIIVMQHSANPFRISLRSRLETHLAFLIFRFFRPDRLLILDDGAGIDDFSKFAKKRKMAIRVVYHGIDTSLFSPGPPRGGIGFLALTTGLLYKNKGIDYAVKGFADFANGIGGANARMTIAGGGAEECIIRDLSTEIGVSDKVDFAGWKSSQEIVGLIRESDVVLGTSLLSNMNRSVLEAMSCGKPVIVFSVESMPNLIEHMRNGILVKPGDVGGISKALCMLHDNRDLGYRLGQEARKTILEKRNWHDRISQEYRVLEESINESRAAET